MNDKFKVKAIYKYGDITSNSFGEIGIRRKEDKKAYVAWNMSDDKGNRLGGVSREYYLGEFYDENKLVEMILENIRRFRINRKRIFFDVEIISEKN